MTMKTMLAACALVQLSAAAAGAQGSPQQLTAPRPIDAVESLWTEELTWMEVRDAVKAGKTTILIGTGGLEQNEIGRASCRERV